MALISGKTALTGLIGKPVSHSVSPIMHNAAFQEMGLDWCYLPMPCEAENVLTVLNGLRNINCKGLNITIPYKKIAINGCNKVSRIGEKLKAINTLTPNESNSWSGENTDITGFIKPLLTEDWNGNHALVLGCGGSARAIVAGLIQLNFEQITIVGRRQIAVTEFINDLQMSFKENKTILNGIQTSNNEKELLHKVKEAKLIINTTPVGMHKLRNKSNGFPFGKEIWEYLEKKTTIYDLIYNPITTEWLELGKEKGCTIINGLEMLINQGAASLKIWSGYDDIPIDIMRKAANQYLLN